MDDQTDPDELRELIKRRIRPTFHPPLLAAADEIESLRARLAQAEAERDRMGNHWRYNRGELSGYTVGEVEYVESKLRAAEAALVTARRDALLEAADALQAKLTRPREDYVSSLWIGWFDGVTEAANLLRARAALVVADTPTAKAHQEEKADS